MYKIIKTIAVLRMPYKPRTFFFKFKITNKSFQF